MLNRLMDAVSRVRAPEITIGGVLFGRYFSPDELCTAVYTLAKMHAGQEVIVTGVLHTAGRHFGRYVIARVLGRAGGVSRVNIVHPVAEEAPGWWETSNVQTDPASAC